MMRLSIIKIMPVIMAIIALILGPPGEFIHRARFGLRNAPRPNKTTITPEIRSIMFAISILSTSVLLLFHTLAFLQHRP